MQVLRNDLYRPWFAGDKDWGFEVLDGEFSGVVVQVESIEFSKKEDGSVDLNYHVINKDSFPDLDITGELFVKTVEIVINDILKEAINHYEQTRDHDTKESS